MNLEIQQFPVEHLIPYARNARTHSDAQVTQIAGSIAEFGFVNPILIGEGGIIIAGHGRLLAAQRLGMKEVPVIMLAHLTETQRRALVIADNRIALNAGWDEEMLKLELADLDGLDFNLDLLGFGDDELDAMLHDPDSVEGLTDDDAVPGVEAEAISKPGDIWILDNHRLLCGDSTLIDSVEKVLSGALADMVFTDPPYNVNYGTTTKVRDNRRSIKNDNLGEEFGEFLQEACANIIAVSKGAIYVCMSSSELDTLQTAFRKAGGHWSTFIIWAKNAFTMGRADYQRQYEPILYGWKEGADHYWCGARNQGDVWFINKPVSNDLHPTMKPVELVQRAIENSSKTRDIVLDPFGGSGTTMIAAEKTGRSARLIELDPLYCDVIVRRWQEFTGKEAIHEEEGRTFADLLSERLKSA